MTFAFSVSVVPLPMPIVAAQTPGDCFWAIQDALRLAVEFMTPVVLLSDGYIANGAEPWAVPKASDIKPITANFPTEANHEDGYMPYLRDERLVRPWARPGTSPPPTLPPPIIQLPCTPHRF